METDFFLIAFYDRSVNERKLSRMIVEGTRTPPMQQEELVTGGGNGTHQTGETSTADKDQHDEEHSLQEGGTQEQLSQHEEDGEEDCEIGLWGHSPLTQHVHDNNQTESSKTRGSSNPVWELVKHIKSRFSHGTRIDCKWTHVCVVPITVKGVREKGDDVDSEGPPHWHCNQLFTLKLTSFGKCYRTSCVTEHVKRKWTGPSPNVLSKTEVGRALSKRAAQGNAHKSKVMEASVTKSGHHSDSASLYTITSEQLCLVKMARW